MERAAQIRYDLLQKEVGNIADEERNEVMAHLANLHEQNHYHAKLQEDIFLMLWVKSRRKVKNNERLSLSKSENISVPTYFFVFVLLGFISFFIGNIKPNNEIFLLIFSVLGTYSISTFIINKIKNKNYVENENYRKNLSRELNNDIEYFINKGYINKEDRKTTYSNFTDNDDFDVSKDENLGFDVPPQD